MNKIGYTIDKDVNHMSQTIEYDKSLVDEFDCSKVKIHTTF